METRRILEYYPVKHDIFAAEKTEHPRALFCGFLRIRRGTSTRRVPDFAVLRKDTSRGHQVLPLRFTHLETLDRPPYLPVAVQHSLATYGDILFPVRADQRLEAPPRCSFIRRSLRVEFPVRREEDYRIFLNMQVYIAPEHDRSCEPYTFRNDKVPAASTGEILYGNGKCLRIECDSIPSPSIVTDIHDKLRDVRRHRRRKAEIPVMIGIRVILRAKTRHDGCQYSQRQHDCEQSPVHKTKIRRHTICVMHFTSKHLDYLSDMRMWIYSVGDILNCALKQRLK